jgi:D-cysteine desulfhydrase/L-cysteate sulfo-lyase
MSLTKDFPRVELSHRPTPLELMTNVSAEFDTRVWIKRDDCTGLAFGGNKSRQLEFYIGQAMEQGADTLLTTGAVQSNHVRMTVAAARKMGLEVEVQLEHRVDREQPEYHRSGNPYLVRLMGAKIHYYPEGEDEAGADHALERRAAELASKGRKAYVIPLSNAHTPYGALGIDRAIACAGDRAETFYRAFRLGLHPYRVSAGRQGQRLPGAGARRLRSTRRG